MANGKFQFEPHAFDRKTGDGTEAKFLVNGLGALVSRLQEAVDEARVA